MSKIKVNLGVIPETLLIPLWDSYRLVSKWSNKISNLTLPPASLSLVRRGIEGEV
jgi:hypothetical protein